MLRPVFVSRHRSVHRDSGAGRAGKAAVYPNPASRPVPGACGRGVEGAERLRILDALGREAGSWSYREGAPIDRFRAVRHLHRAAPGSRRCGAGDRAHHRATVNQEDLDLKVATGSSTSTTAWLRPEPVPGAVGRSCSTGSRTHRAPAQAAAKEGHVRVNGKAEKPSYKVKPGDAISVVLPYPSGKWNCCRRISPHHPA